MSIISTGSYDLNEWLKGGYETGIVTMLVGGPGSGKTNFSILAACSCAKEKKVIYIDTEGGFSPERIKQIVGEKNYESILSNILLFNPTTFNEERPIFENLKKHVKKENAGLIIVDSMAMLYRLELGDAIQSQDEDKIQEVNREVARQMRVLVEIARKEDLPVIITNQVYFDFLKDGNFQGVEKKSNIVGGDLFKYWSKCIIELSGKGRSRKAVLLKHRNLAESELNFEINDLGIFKKKGLF